MSNSYGCPECGDMVVDRYHHYNRSPARECSYWGTLVPTPAEHERALLAELTAREQLAAEVARLRLREQAREVLADERSAELGAGREQRAARLLAELLDIDALDQIAEPSPLVADLLFKDSLARVNGPSGHGKSFVVLDMAACVATGTRWHGHAVEQGPVIYMAAEGAPGLKVRARAWQERHGVKMAGVTFLPRPIQAAEEEWETFIAAVGALDPAPVLIVVDTQARVTVGLEENSATEMGRVVDSLERLRRATGACVLLVHHRGLTGEHGRGSSAVRGALDTELDVSKVRDAITLKVVKQKDAAEAAPMALALTPLGDSAVLLAEGESLPGADGFIDPIQQADPGVVRVLALVKVMVDNFDETETGGSRADVRALFYDHPDIRGLGKAVQRSAFHRAWGRLERLGRLGQLAGRERFKFLTLNDLDPLGANPNRSAPMGWILSESETDKTGQAS